MPDTRPEANFTADPRSGNTGTTVTFTDLSTTVSGGEILSWQWNFGDGSRSNAPNPVHTYLVSGDFTVSLTVVSSRGSHTRTRPGYIQISSPSGSDELDSEGGTVSANNVSITVPEGALGSRVEFGITQTSATIDFNAIDETIYRVGDTFEVTHNSTTPLSTSSESDPIQPAVLSIPYTEDAVPTGSRLSAKVHIVAQLESGEVIPILGAIRSGRVEAMVSDLPRRALYTVIYRPDAYLATATVNTKAPTTTDWEQTWNVSLSPALLEQLTALRLGDIAQDSSFFERDFTEEELAATETALLEGIVSMQEQFESVQSRAPRLVSRNGAYAVHCFNFLALYGTPSSIADVLYAGRPFGSIVIDPRQLLALSAWNASRLADDANADVGFVVAANRAFSEELARAVVAGYDYPDVTVGSPSDGADAHFAAGIEDGLALYLGQMGQGMDASRSQLAGDFALVSTPLLSPIDLTVPDYSHASQEFYRYIDNRYAPASPLGYIAGGTGSIKGLLEEIRLSLEDLISPGYAEVAGLVSVAIDDAFLERLDVSLGDAYFNYALDLAFEHGTNSLLRPSDDVLLPLVLDESRFGAGTVFSGTLAGPDSGLDFPQSGATGLTAISPLSTRAIVVAADPSAASLTFEFNRDEWAADARGRSIEVVVYREGLPGTPLGAEESALVFTDFEADAGRDMAFFYVLVVNTSISTPSSVELSVISSSTAPAEGASG